MKGYRIAIVGATGAVGTKMIQMLEQSTLPIQEVRAFASKRSVGKTVLFRQKKVIIEALVPESFEEIDLALFSAGGSISKEFASEAVKHGAIVIDNTSYFRMNPNVPLVVPEVNKEDLKKHQGIIANPNCSTIQMMVALEPIRQKVGIERIIVSTYQAVSGAGAKAVFELEQQTQSYLNRLPKKEWQTDILPCGSDQKHYPLAFNALPQIDVFAEDDYTFEEWKMINETKKIMHDQTIKVVATCVRIPVVQGHSESIYVETKEKIDVSEVRELMEKASGVCLEDDPSQQIYPQALNSVNRKETFVGRIRKDPDIEKGLHLWVVSDNLLKGAAWNSVQIAETLHEMNLIHG